MNIKIERWLGGWWLDDCEVIRVTKTMVVVADGPTSEERFNRRTGRLIGGPTGQIGMTNPHVVLDELRKLEDAQSSDLWGGDVSE